MRNVHVSQTDKPSRLIHNDANQLCYQSNKSFKNDRKLRKKFNIYITSDEEIKEGDWCLLNNRLVVRYFKPPVESKSFKKIILTTDQDLIKDGVQAIDDEFLEWFVKNPSCEEVEIDKNWNYPLDKSWEYKIRIPQELPIVNGSYGCTIQTKRQETLEELVDRLPNKKAKELGIFLQGAKWQQEQQPHNFLPGFVKQFDPKNGEIDGEEWSAIQLLRWLELNKFKIEQLTK